MDIVNRNQVKNIHFVKGRLEDTAIPVPDKVDIIISEWMGYFLLFEGMLDSVIYARDHHLKENGIILPNRCNISLVAFGDEQRHREFISFWEDVYGFDMTTLQPEVLKEAIVEECKNEHVLSDPVVIAEFNMMTADYSCPNFSFDFQMAIHKEGKLTAFVGYFDTFFDLPEAISFSTGPQTTPTHWKQVKLLIYMNARERDSSRVRIIKIYIYIYGNRWSSTFGGRLVWPRAKWCRANSSVGAA